MLVDASVYWFLFVVKLTKIGSVVSTVTSGGQVDNQGIFG